MITNKLIHRTFLITSVLCALACSKDDSKPGVSKPVVPGEARDINTKPTAFESQGEFSEVVKDFKERNKIEYTFGCQKAGEYVDDSSRIDAAVKVGHRKLSISTISRSDIHMERISGQTVTAIDSSGKSSEFENELLSLDIQEAGGQTLLKKVVSKSACHEIEEENDGQKSKRIQCEESDQDQEKKVSDFMDSLTVAGSDFFKNMHQDNSFESCYIKDIDSDGYQSKTEIGLYSFKNKKITALKRTSSYTGEIICTRNKIETSMGKGKTTSIVIRSNEIVPDTESFHNCGGYEIISGSTTYLGDKVIGSYREEVLDAPLR